MLNKFKKRDDDAIRAKEEAARAAMEGDVTYRHGVGNGKNYFIVVPHFEGLLPYRHLMVHWTPSLHLCNAPDPVLNTGGGDGLYIEPKPWDDSCWECVENFETYKANGKKEGGPAVTRKFLDGKSSAHTAILVINVTPFFKGGKFSAADMDKYGQAFYDILIARLTSSENIPKPEDMPDNIYYAAMCGVEILIMKNKSKAQYGHALVAAINSAEETAQNYGQDSPLYAPDQNLLVIDKVRTGTIKTEKGDEIPEVSWNFKIENSRANGWTWPDCWDGDRIFDPDVLRDIHDLSRNTEKYDTPDKRAAALCPMTNEELRDWLDSVGYSFQPDDEPDDVFTEDDESEPATSSTFDDEFLVDTMDEDVPVATSDQKAKMAAVRDRLRAQKQD